MMVKATHTYESTVRRNEIFFGRCYLECDLNWIDMVSNICHHFSICFLSTQMTPRKKNMETRSPNIPHFHSLSLSLSLLMHQKLFCLFPSPHFVLPLIHSFILSLHKTLLFFSAARSKRDPSSSFHLHRTTFSSSHFHTIFNTKLKCLSIVLRHRLIFSLLKPS